MITKKAQNNIPYTILGIIATLIATVPYYVLLNSIQTLDHLGPFFRASWPFAILAFTSLVINGWLVSKSVQKSAKIFLVLFLVINLFNTGLITYYFIVASK